MQRICQGAKCGPLSQEFRWRSHSGFGPLGLLPLMAEHRRLVKLKRTQTASCINGYNGFDLYNRCDRALPFDRSHLHLLLGDYTACWPRGLSCLYWVWWARSENWSRSSCQQVVVSSRLLVTNLTNYSRDHGLLGTRPILASARDRVIKEDSINPN